MGELKIAADAQGVTFAVKVIPRAPRDEIVGVENDAVKIRLHAPPVEGKANQALVEFLARLLNVTQRQVEIVRGHNARLKLVRVIGVGKERVMRVIGERVKSDE